MREQVINFKNNHIFKISLSFLWNRIFLRLIFCIYEYTIYFEICAIQEHTDIISLFNIYLLLSLLTCDQGLAI